MTTRKQISLNSTAAGVSSSESKMKDSIHIQTETSENVHNLRKQVYFGLIEPKDEQLLTGGIMDNKLMQSKVIYPLDGAQGIAEATIDKDTGVVTLNTEGASQATENNIIKIITLVCNHVECIASYLEAHLQPPAGYIKPKKAKIDVKYGEKTSFHISSLYTLDNVTQNASNNSALPETDSSGKNTAEKQDL